MVRFLSGDLKNDHQLNGINDVGGFDHSEAKHWLNVDESSILRRFDFGSPMICDGIRL